LWLEDPDGNLVEIYARLTSDELAEKPENLEPTALA
jgi:catechol-2,3-dioxygenase